MSQPSLNPLLAKVKLPGRVFQLPSKGLFYEPGILAESVKDGEIQVKPMSGLTELKVRSADLLISNKVISEICVECCPDIVKPEQLLAKDVDALFLFLLASTYGNQKSIRSIHDCAKAEVHDYMIDLNQIISNPNNKMLDYRDTILTCDLPNGQVVKLRPVKFIDSVDMLLLRQAISKKEADRIPVHNEELENLVIRDMLSVLQSVSTGGADSIEVKDLTKIDEWIRALSKTYIDLIVETAVKAGEWGFEFNVKLKCKDCGKEYDHNLEFNPINFFSG